MKKTRDQILNELVTIDNDIIQATARHLDKLVEKLETDREDLMEELNKT